MNEEGSADGVLGDTAVLNPTVDKSKFSRSSPRPENSPRLESSAMAEWIEDQSSPGIGGGRVKREGLVPPGHTTESDIRNFRRDKPNVLSPKGRDENGNPLSSRLKVPLPLVLGRRGAMDSEGNAIFVPPVAEVKPAGIEPPKLPKTTPPVYDYETFKKSEEEDVEDDQRLEPLSSADDLKIYRNGIIKRLTVAKKSGNEHDIKKYEDMLRDAKKNLEVIHKTNPPKRLSEPIKPSDSSFRKNGNIPYVPPVGGIAVNNGDSAKKVSESEDKTKDAKDVTKTSVQDNLKSTLEINNSLATARERLKKAVGSGADLTVKRSLANEVDRLEKMLDELNRKTKTDSKYE